MKFFSSVLLATLLCGCVPYGSSTYRGSSPIRVKVGWSRTSAEIRAGIVEVIPLGTPRHAVEQLIGKNFHTPIVADHTADITYFRPHPDWSSFEIHLYDYVSLPIPFKRESADARFLFTKDGKLQDVLVNAGDTEM